MYRTVVAALALTGALSGVVSGCSALADDTAGTQVAAAFYPLQFAADRVAGGLADVETLTKPGGEPHDLEMNIRETAVLAQADVVVYERGFQAAVDDAVDQNATGEVVDVATVADLVPFSEHGAAEKGADPHFWQDPLRLADVGDAIADALAEADPGHTQSYTSNAADLRSDLEDLDQAYRAGLAGCERTTIVVSHDAFGYLDTYGLQVAPIAGLSPEAEPTPADLGRLQQLIDDDGITTVFGERLAPARLSETLASDAGVRTAILDPIEGLTDETADEDYLTLMRQNLAELEEANGCG